MIFEVKWTVSCFIIGFFFNLKGKTITEVSKFHSASVFSALWPRNMTLSGFKDSVMELVLFVGRLASLGLQLEGCHSLLLSFVLDFYETVIKSNMIWSVLWCGRDLPELCRLIYMLFNHQFHCHKVTPKGRIVFSFLLAKTASKISILYKLFVMKKINY